MQRALNQGQQSLRAGMRGHALARRGHDHPPQLRAVVWMPRATFVNFGGYRPTGVGGHRRPMNTGLLFVPQQQAWVVERFGKFSRILDPGLQLLVPIIEDVAYVHSLKEETIAIPNQSAVTRDNVTVHIDGVLYFKVLDAFKTSYDVADPVYAVTQLAQTTMRSQLGKMSLDQIFRERESLNQEIMEVMESSAANWGLKVQRYEIREVTPSEIIRQAMDLQAEAERRKRAQILEAEATLECEVNVAKGKKRALELVSEGERTQLANKGVGEAEAVKALAQATAASVESIAAALQSQAGVNAAGLRVAEQYVEAFRHIAKTGNTVILPSPAGDPASMVAQAMAIYKASSSIPTAPTCSIDAGTAESEADCIEPDQPAKHPSSSSSF